MFDCTARRWEMKWDLVCTSVFRSLRSARMRARTGKAVIDSATPRNTVKAPMLWSEPTLRILHMMYDTIAPRPNGSIMPAAAIHTVMTPDLPREFPGQLFFCSIKATTVTSSVVKTWSQPVHATMPSHSRLNTEF